MSFYGRLRPRCKPGRRVVLQPRCKPGRFLRYSRNRTNALTNHSTMVPFSCVVWKVVFVLAFVANAVRSLGVRRGFAVGKKNKLDHKLVMKTIDGFTPSSLDDCFTSRKGKKAWARYDIPWSVVTHVNILNAPAGSS